MAKARAEAKLKRWRDAYAYSERVFLRIVKRLRAVREAQGFNAVCAGAGLVANS